MPLSNIRCETREGMCGCSGTESWRTIHIPRWVISSPDLPQPVPGEACCRVRHRVLLPTKFRVRKQRILVSGTWCAADSQRHSFFKIPLDRRKRRDNHEVCTNPQVCWGFVIPLNLEKPAEGSWRNVCITFVGEKMCASRTAEAQSGRDCGKTGPMARRARQEIQPED